MSNLSLKYLLNLAKSALEAKQTELAPTEENPEPELTEIETLFLSCSIEKGRAGYLPETTPYILLAAEKVGNDNLLEDSALLKKNGEILVFIGQSSLANEDAVLDCYELADYIFQLLRDAFGQRILSAKSETDSYYNNISVVLLTLGVFTNA